MKRPLWMCFSASCACSTRRRNPSHPDARSASTPNRKAKAVVRAKEGNDETPSPPQPRRRPDGQTGEREESRAGRRRPGIQGPGKGNQTGSSAELDCILTTIHETAMAL